MRLSKVRRQYLSELAEGIADDYFPKSRVNPVLLSERLGIPVAFGRYGRAFDGALECKNGKFCIYVNLDRVDSVDSTRARFTVSHELGHYFIDEHRIALKAGRSPGHPSRCEYESDSSVELEADHFASCLLMPEMRFSISAKRYPIGWSGIRSLSTTFGTSWTSTVIRVASLNIHPYAVIKWHNEGFGWKWISEAFLDHSRRKTIESTSDVAIGGATQRILSGESPGEPGSFKNGTTASAWFPSIPQGGESNQILIEEAVSLGRFGALTILYPAKD